METKYTLGEALELVFNAETMLSRLYDTEEGCKQFEELMDYECFSCWLDDYPREIAIEFIKKIHQFED